MVLKRRRAKRTSKLAGCKSVKTVKRTVCTPSGRTGRVVCKKKSVKVCVRSGSSVRPKRNRRSLLRRRR